MNGEIEIECPITEIYIPTKSWYAFVDDTNRVVRTLGSMFPITNLTCSDTDSLRVIDLGNINEEAWSVLNKIVNVPYYDGILDEKRGEVIYYKLKARLRPAGEPEVPGNAIVPDIEKVDGKYFTNSGKITITIECLDEAGEDVIQPGYDTGNLQMKKLRVTNPSGLSNKLRLLTVDHPKFIRNTREIHLDRSVHDIFIEEPGEYTIRVTYNHVTPGLVLNFERYITICYALPVDINDS